MERPDIIFCKMLNYQSNMLGSFDSPVIVNEQNLKNALRLGQPNIMQQIKCWIIMAKENRMVVSQRNMVNHGPHEYHARFFKW